MGMFDDLENCDRVTEKGKPHNVIRRLSPKTEGQMRYLEAIESNRVVFAHGPAGTGKSFLAAGSAAMALNNGEVEQIFCVRPAVGAGERNGFLPGSSDEKLAPYLRPIMIELRRFFTPGQFASYRRKPDGEEMAVIEIQPIEFMRGLTFRNAFIVVDEAQNCTEEQMKMIVTRLGKGSRMVINGDETQSDLPHALRGGFGKYSRMFGGIDAVGTVYMGREDVVRDPLLKLMMERIESAG